MRFLGFLLVLILVLAVVGHFLGWISFTSETQGGERRFGVTLNHEEVTDDLAKAASKVQGFLEKVGKGDVKGKVESVDARTGQVVVVTENGERLPLTLPPDVALTIDGADARVGRLKPGDAVTLTVDDAQVKRVAVQRR